MISIGAAGVALAVGYSVYYLISREEGTSGTTNDELPQDIKKIGIVEVNSDGIFSFNKFVEIF